MIGHDGLSLGEEAEAFRATAHEVVELLATYLSAIDHSPVLSLRPPDNLLSQWHRPFPRTPSPSRTAEILSEVIRDSIHIHHPRFVGHQVCPPLTTAAVCDFVSAFLNNGAAVYEMGPLAAVFEKILVEWMAQQLKWNGEEAGGFFTSGGSLGNLTALLAARQAKAGEDYWREGAREPLGVLVSDQAHYCTSRAVQMMGWGEKGAILVPSDDKFKMDLSALEERYISATKDGRKVIAVVGSACSTSTGSFDDLNALADFCQERDLWLHIDGAHGASLALTDEYRHLLSGIERVDSVVWDAHKMLLMPALTTAVLFRNKEHSYHAFSQSASYIYEGEMEDEWYNLGKRTVECTKSLMAMKLYVSLMTHGTDYFAGYITSMISLCRMFAEHLMNQSDFEVPVSPECNILCFRYLREGYDEAELDELQGRIRDQIVRSGEFYLVKTVLRGTTYLRITIINPRTEVEELFRLLDRVREIGSRPL